MDRNRNIDIKEIANRLGMDRSNARKCALQNGFEFVRVRTSESRGQLTLALPESDFQSLLELRREQGFIIGDNGDMVASNENGTFYIIQLVPELSANRMKLGFATSMTSRLRSHKTTSPTAKLIESWPCRAVWEAAAISSITRIDCEWVGGEVFDCGDVDALRARGEEFFAIMPKPKD